MLAGTRDSLEAVLNGFAEAQDTKFGKLAGPCGRHLQGRAVTPSVFDMMLVLGREESLARLNDAATDQVNALKGAQVTLATGIAAPCARASAQT